jgi:hypothetical protein
MLSLLVLGLSAACGGASEVSAVSPALTPRTAPGTTATGQDASRARPPASAIAAEPGERAADRTPPDTSGLPPADPGLGRLRVVTVRSDHLRHADVFTSFEDLAVVSDDDAWIVGAGNVRLLCRASACRPMPAPVVQVPLGDIGGTCEGVPHFWRLVARSANEIFVAGTMGCGMDPSYVYNRELERFDGQGWRPLVGSMLPGTPHDQSPGAMAAASRGPLWILASGDSWGGATGNAVLRWQGTSYAPVARHGLGAAERASLARAAASQAAPPPPPKRWESYQAAVARDDGWVWVVGGLHEVVQAGDASDTRVTPASWIYDGVKWSAQPVPPMPALDGREGLMDLSLGEDGSVWAAGGELLEWTAGQWRPVALGWPEPLRVSSVWARNRREVWLVASTVTEAADPSPMVLRFDGTGCRRIGVDGEAPAVVRVRGRGAALWAISADTVWRLVTTGTTPPTATP